MQDRKDAGQDACRTGRMQDRADAGQDRCRRGRMQERTDAGQDRCRTNAGVDRFLLLMGPQYSTYMAVGM